MRLMKTWAWVLVCAACAACGDDSMMDDSNMEHGDDHGAAGGAPHAGAGGAAGAAGSAGGGTTANADGVDVAALKATGLDKYLGAAKPAMMEPNGAETKYTFNQADGPQCLRGTPFAMGTRDKGSEDLIIYLQGGGSCTTALCRATETTTGMIPPIGVLNGNDMQNPVAGWNVVYSPYCDGSLHFGDSDIPDMNRAHHGLRNLSASLDVAKDKFPNPKRILLTGSSAGGYGTIWATTLVRLIYPDAKLYVFNDAGIALSNPASPEGFRGVLGEWGAVKFIPEGCEACKSTPHLTQWQSWNLDHIPNIKIGMFSSYEDSVIAGTFLMLDPAMFKQALLDETAKVVATDPKRAKRFLVAGMQHTVSNFNNTKVGDLTVNMWLKQMIEEDPAWDNQLQ